ncbi:MAG: hypothetical protein ACRDT4_19795 [Micromonosporaceae bacterium]
MPSVTVDSDADPRSTGAQADTNGANGQAGTNGRAGADGKSGPHGQAEAADRASIEPAAVTGGPGPAPRPRWQLAAAGVAAAWLLPVTTHLFGVDWLLPLAIWTFTASLLRSGKTLLDRMMLAAVLLIGATSAAGLVMSVWPWGIAPVPVAGTALTALVGIAVALRRRPQLRLPVRGSDLLVLGTGALAALLVLLPYAGRSFAERIGLVLLGEDFARHFSLYDAIGLTGHYAFLERQETAPYLLFGMQTYPQGSHFLYALLDSFLRSGAPATDAASSFEHYIGYHMAGYAFFAMVVLWAARWVAPGTLHGWPKVAVYTFVIAAVTFSELFAMYVRGYPGEILGLSLYAVLVALVARPPRHTRELIITIGALLVGASWAYFFLLPFVGGIAIVALIGYRHRLLRRWGTALVAAVVTIPLALLPFVVYSDRASPLEDLLPGGPVEGVNRPMTVGVAALLIAGLAAAPRSPVWRMIGVQLFLVGGMSILLGVYQLVAVGQLSYYFDKAGHALLVTCLVGLSGLTPLLARVRRQVGDSARPDRRRKLLEVAVGVTVVFGIMASFGAVPLQRPSEHNDEPIRNVSWATAYAVGNLNNRHIAAAVDGVLRRNPEADGRLTQVIVANKDHSYLCTLFVSVLHRNYGTLIRVPTSATPLYYVEDLDVTIADYPGRPRRIVVINSPETAQQIQEVLDARPDLDVELVSIEVEPPPDDD